MVIDINYDVQEYLLKAQNIIYDYENSGAKQVGGVLSDLTLSFNNSFPNDDQRSTALANLASLYKCQNMGKKVETLYDFLSKESFIYFLAQFKEIANNDFLLDSKYIIPAEKKKLVADSLLLIESIKNIVDLSHKEYCGKNNIFTSVYLEPSDDEIAICVKEAKSELVNFLLANKFVVNKKLNFIQKDLYAYVRDYKDVTLLFYLVTIAGLFYFGVVQEHLFITACATSVMGLSYLSFSVYDILFPNQSLKPSVNPDTVFSSNVMRSRDDFSSYTDMLEQQDFAVIDYEDDFKY